MDAAPSSGGDRFVDDLYLATVLATFK